jgi:hypothetical protein
VLDLVLIPPYAGIGAAVASTIAYTATGVMMGVFFLRALGGTVRELIPKREDLGWFPATWRAARRRPSDETVLAGPMMPVEDVASSSRTDRSEILPSTRAEKLH